MARFSAAEGGVKEAVSGVDDDKVRSLSPLLGEHTDEVLLGLGYSKEEIVSLRKEGVVG